MFCKRCGKEVDDDSQFCSYCGQLLSFTKKDQESIKGISNNQKGETLSYEIKQPSYNSNIEKYDILYNRNKSLFKYGIIGLVFFSVPNLLVVFTNIESTNTYNDVAIILNVISFAVRLVLINWFLRFVREMNRNPWLWALFFVFMPGLALVSLGLKKKKLYPKDFVVSPQKEQANFFNNYAARLAKGRNIDYSEYFIDKAIKLDPENHFCYDTRGFIKFQKDSFNEAIEDYTKSIEMDNTYGEKYFNRGYAKLKINDTEGAILDLKAAEELGYTKAKDLLSKHYDEGIWIT